MGRYIGALALVIIGGVNLFSIKKWGRTGTAILASKVVTRTHILGPIGSASITGLGFGFDTATQISALTISAVASPTLGVQIAISLLSFLPWV